MLHIASKHASLEGPLPELSYRTKTSLQSVCQHHQPVHVSKIRARQDNAADCNPHVKLPEQASNKRRCHLDNHGTCRADQGVIYHRWAN